jgi:hypothetical protein
VRHAEVVENLSCRDGFSHLRESLLRRLKIPRLDSG